MTKNLTILLDSATYSWLIDAARKAGAFPDAFVEELVEQARKRDEAEPGTRECLECGQHVQVRADGKFVMHTLAVMPIECQGSEKAAYSGGVRIPETTQTTGEQQ